MKKLYIILALIIVSILMVFAGDTIKILRIYHNGTFTAIPLANIESVNHSKNIVSSYIDTVDSTYNFPINEIDSVVVTEADIKEYKDNLKTIRDHIFESKEQLSVEQYQANLLIWLRGCDFVSKTTLSDLKDLIIIEFTNGLNLYINFVNLDDYSDINDNSMANARRVNPNDKYKQTHFDVSSVTDEEIVNPNILYIQGRSMPSREEEQEESNAAKEWEQLDSIHNFSPVNGTLIPNFKSIKFLYEKYSEYGLVIISQTHGGNQRSGRFQVEDDQAIDNILKKEGIDYLEYLRPLIKNEDRISMNLYVRGEKVGIPSSELYVYDINPKHIGRLLHNNIIYGSYCYSYDLYDKGIKGINNSTVYGYTTKIWYHYNNLKETPAKDSLISHINRFLNGYTYNDANWPKPYTVNNSLQVPQTNKPKVKQRYFSILTNDITLNNEIIGEIKGYKNLKKELKWILFAHEGPNKFTPKDNNVKRIEDAYKPDANGNFTISSDIVNQYPDHAFIVGFEYAGKVYYGEMKRPFHKLCPDENHPHLIDLGLPSGTQWYCCNKGVHQVDQLGSLYSWEDRGTVPSLEQWYELCHLDYFDYSINGNEGKLFVGNKGYCIFLPEGSYWTTKRDGSTATCANISQGLSVNFSGCVGVYDKKPKPIAHSRNIVN